MYDANDGTLIWAKEGGRGTRDTQSLCVGDWAPDVPGLETNCNPFPWGMMNPKDGSRSRDHGWMGAFTFFWDGDLLHEAIHGYGIFKGILRN